MMDPLCPLSPWERVRVRVLSLLQRAQHDIQPYPQPDGQPALVHLEFWGVVWTSRATRGNTHTEVAAWPLLQEQTHVIAGHDDVAVFDRLAVQFVQRTLLHEGRLGVVIHHGRTALAHEGEMRVSLVGMGYTAHKSPQALDDLLP